MKRVLFLVVALVLLPVSEIFASYDNYHFYRAGYFFGEPRFEKNWLSTIELSLAGGSTCKSRGPCGQTVPLFDIYGTSNMQALGNGVPGKSVTNAADLALINLSRLPVNDGFAQLSFPGSFSIVECDINAIQNIAAGFFAQLYIPVRRFNICAGNFIDLSPSASVSSPNVNTPAWQIFLNNFGNILAQYDLSLASIKRTAIGDVTFLAGWTKNYQNTKILDYIDTTVKLGVLANTAPAKNENLVFDIATGYDKHIGFPLSLDVSIGAFDWLTAGFHGGVLPFLNRCQDIRMKTDYNQSGVIKLAKGMAVVGKGPIWDLGMFVKTDHVGQRFSLLFAYTFIAQGSDSICPIINEVQGVVFDSTIVNSDTSLQGWTMHNLNFLAEYDFTREDSKFGPRVGFLVNAQVGGTRIFQTNMLGGYFGLDIAWSL